MRRSDCLNVIQEAVDYAFKIDYFYLTSQDKRDIQNLIDELRDNIGECGNIIETLKIAKVAVEASYGREFVRKYENVIKEIERMSGYDR